MVTYSTSYVKLYNLNHVTTVNEKEFIRMVNYLFNYGINFNSKVC